MEAPTVVIPPPAVVRFELAEAMRRANRLKELLPIAERAERDRRELAEIAATQGVPVAATAKS